MQTKGNRFTILLLGMAILLAVCRFNARAISLPDGPDVGQIAPTLKLSTWLQAPPEAARGWPTGKVVVLEFWGIGCGACVAAIPHLNELADEFQGKPVQFIAVTEDDEAAVRGFLKKTPIKAWIGLGADAGFGGSTPYRVAGIPHTVLIDAQGRIALITDPRQLTARTIQECLDGSLGLPAGGGVAATDPAASARDYFTSSGGTIPGLIPGQYRMGLKPLFQVLIQRTPTNSPTHSRPVETWSPDAMTLQNVELSRAIEIAFNTKPARILAEAELPKDKYDFVMNAPPVKDRQKRRDRYEAVFAQAVAATFGVTVKRETREVDLLVLRTNATAFERLSQSGNPGGRYLLGPCEGDKVEASASDKPLSSLAEALETVAEKPVLDETGLTNHFSYHIKWEQKDFHQPNFPGMTAALSQLGLELVPAKKSVELIVVSETL